MSSMFGLIIEDDQDLSVIFSEALQAAGFETEIIRAGDLALERLATTTPSVVVLDLHLPRVAGTDILRHIRADTRLADTRVIVATAHPHMAESLRDEADLVLLKPISFSQLRDLAAILGTARPRSK
jgi:two-component system phosphate regulon response regulator PhoB